MPEGHTIHRAARENTRWVLLKRRKNLTRKQRGRLRELLAVNFKTVRAYLLKDDLDMLWRYRSTTWTGKFLGGWVTTALSSRIEPMAKFARTLCQHRPLILNWFRAR